jgi:putative transposase
MPPYVSVLRAIAQERRRFGCRRLHVLLRREGYLVNHKKLFRLYREERLAVRRPGGRGRAERELRELIDDGKPNSGHN